MCGGWTGVRGALAVLVWPVGTQLRPKPVRHKPPRLPSWSALLVRLDLICSAGRALGLSRLLSGQVGAAAGLGAVHASVS